MEKTSEAGMLQVNEKTQLYYEYDAHPDVEHTLVFVHAHSVDCRMWDLQVRHFSPYYSVLRYDLRGYGQSSLPEEGQSFWHAEDLKTLLDRLCIQSVHLVGLSLGSFVALDFWALYPERVRSVTTASGAIPDQKPKMATPLVSDVAQFKNEWYARMLEGCGKGDDNHGFREILRGLIADWSAWQVTHTEPNCLLGEKLIPLLATMKSASPLCVIQGEMDFEGARQSGQKLLDLMPHAVSIQLSKAGHFSNMESPEEFNLGLQNFIGGTHIDS